MAAVTGLIGYILITRIDYYDDRLNSPILPTTVMVFIGFMLGTIFMNVYGMTGDTLLHCFCVDEEMNSGIAKQKNCPDRLKDLMKDERE